MRMAHSIESLSTVMERYISHSAAAAHTTNSYLKNLVQKVELPSLPSSRSRTQRVERSDTITTYDSVSELSYSDS
jgi:hypothetical protein